MTEPRDQVLRVEPRVILTELEDGTGLLLHLGTKLYFTLNEPGVFVWKTLAQGPRSREAVTRALVERYAVVDVTAGQDLELLLHEMIDERLVHTT